MGNIESDRNAGWFKRIWCFLGRPSSLAWTIVAAGGFVVGIMFWGGFNWAVELTNTETFCISCHEMRDNVYPELQKTIHWANRSGVRATCPDCHVPHPWIYKIKRKIQASNELFHKILGTIDTREKFEAHRLELAEHVWAAMKSTDSRECRNCHAVRSMDSHKQKPEAAQTMQEGFKAGLTCIDCHKGIAHQLPKDPDDTAEHDKNESQNKG